MTDINTTAAIDPIKLAARLVAEQGRLAARLEEITAQLVPLAAIAETFKAEAAARAVIDVDGLPAGAKVEFVFGRKENRVTNYGAVIGFAPAEGKLPARYKIEVGSGFDTVIFAVAARDVKVAE